MGGERYGEVGAEFRESVPSHRIGHHRRESVPEVAKTRLIRFAKAKPGSRFESFVLAEAVSPEIDFRIVFRRQILFNQERRSRLGRNLAVSRTKQGKRVFVHVLEQSKLGDGPPCVCCIERVLVIRKEDNTAYSSFLMFRLMVEFYHITVDFYHPKQHID